MSGTWTDLGTVSIGSIGTRRVSSRTDSGFTYVTETWSFDDNLEEIYKFGTLTIRWTNMQGGFTTTDIKVDGVKVGSIAEIATSSRGESGTVTYNLNNVEGSIIQCVYKVLSLTDYTLGMTTVEAQHYEESVEPEPSPSIGEFMKGLRIGNTGLSNIYIGNTKHNKIYLGDKLIFGQDTPPVESIWNISSDGTSADLLEIPNVIPADTTFSAEYQTEIPITASLALAGFGGITESGSGSNPTAYVDGGTRNYMGSGGKSRNSLLALTGQLSGTNQYINGKYNMQIEDEHLGYLITGNTGELTGWTPTFDASKIGKFSYPENAISLNDSKDAITVKAGEYDTNRRSLPQTLENDVVLNKMDNSMWTTEDWSIMMFLQQPSSYSSFVDRLNYTDNPMYCIASRKGYYTIKDNSKNSITGVSSSQTRIAKTPYYLTRGSGTNWTWASATDWIEFTCPITNEVKSSIDDMFNYELRIPSDTTWDSSFTVSTKNTFYKVVASYEDGTTETIAENWVGYTGKIEDRIVVDNDKIRSMTQLVITLKPNTASSDYSSKTRTFYLNWSFQGFFAGEGYSQVVVPSIYDGRLHMRVEESKYITDLDYNNYYFLNFNSNSEMESITTIPLYPVN